MLEWRKELQEKYKAEEKEQALRSVKEIIGLLDGDCKSEIGYRTRNSRKIFSSKRQHDICKLYFKENKTIQDISRELGIKQLQHIKNSITDACLTLNYRHGIGYRFSFGRVEEALSLIQKGEHI